MIFFTVTQKSCHFVLPCLHPSVISTVCSADILLPHTPSDMKTCWSILSKFFLINSGTISLTPMPNMCLQNPWIFSNLSKELKVDSVSLQSLNLLTCLSINSHSVWPNLSFRMAIIFSVLFHNAHILSKRSSSLNNTTSFLALLLSFSTAISRST